MKTLTFIKAVLLFTVFMIGTSLAVSAGSPEQAPAASIRANIADNLTMPDRHVMPNVEGVVDVLFMIDEGKICVEEVTSDNAELAKYVKKGDSTKR